MDKKKFKGLWLTDFDGTMLPGGENSVSPIDLNALKRIGRDGWFRVVVTGRSLFGFVKAWQPGLEIDGLIFSSGAGMCFWDHMGPGPLVSSAVFNDAQIEIAIEASLNLGFGFFAYVAPPDSHHFYYHAPAKPPFGFTRRIEIFETQSRPWPDRGLDLLKERGLSQILIMVPAPLADQAEKEFTRLAPGLSVIRSSSPFGDNCLWLEVFHPAVSKGRAAAALADALKVAPAMTVALGNDYNDHDLLDWAAHAFITSDAPPEMLPGRNVMPPAGQGGQAWAYEKVLKLLGD